LTEDPVIHICLKFQRNTKQTYDCQEYLVRKCGSGICRDVNWIVNT